MGYNGPPPYTQISAEDNKWLHKHFRLTNNYTGVFTKTKDLFEFGALCEVEELERGRGRERTKYIRRDQAHE